MGVDFGREDQKIEDENEQEQDHEHEHDYDWWGVMSWARQPRKPRLRRNFALPEPDLLLAGNDQKIEDEDEQEQDHEHEHDYDWWRVVSGARQPGKPRFWRRFVVT
jgi:hypothetical protein